MKRTTKLLLAGGALMLAIAAYDRANRTETTLSAQVTAIEARMADEGPDTWHITAQTPAGLITLSPLPTRPNLTEGDAICVTRLTRMGRSDDHRWAPAATDC